MIHILSSRYHQEFSGLIEGVRFGIAADRDSHSSAPLGPVLLIKAVTITLKYFVRLRTFRLLFWKTQSPEYLWYGVQIADDPAHPGTLWSIAESDEELTAVARLLKTEQLSVFLFNEEGINVASARMRIRFAEPNGISIITEAKPAPEGTSTHSHTFIESLLAPGSSMKLHEATPAEPCEWREVQARLLTQRLSSCDLAMMTGEEGDQQELLAEWLMDALGAPVSVRNPIVHEQKGRPRELSDLLLSHEYGSFLLESKALAIIARDVLPDRLTLRRQVLKHLNKAISQLTGACANIRRGLRITDQVGRDLAMTRDQPIHCIVLVPDLDIIADCDMLVPKLSLSILQKAKGFLNLLDIVELRRLVHNARHMASNSKLLTPIMAFDGILLKRFELISTQRTPDVRFSMTLGTPNDH
ncbi:MAG TPA: hypothetical protein VHA33_21190 [Candidatus Angelobacter sp.]|jgi:hypothetical protein|nr:hypothetical protein [Candidatus Angelobacter sp.]